MYFFYSWSCSSSLLDDRPTTDLEKKKKKWRKRKKQKESREVISTHFKSRCSLSNKQAW